MKIGFIGAGKMARALADGLVRGRIARADEITCSSRSAESGRGFLKLVPGSHWTHDNAGLMFSNELVILALKPQQFADALPTLSNASAGKLILSLAAGVTTVKIAGLLDPTARLVRAMPNTPMQIGLGASAYAAGPGATADDLALIEKILASAGKAWRVQENQMDAVTALSGSGPAYVYHFIDALIRAAVPLGLDEQLARELALQTVLGATVLTLNSNLPPMVLADQVKSPGGTTLAGCEVLEKNNALNDLLARTLAAAKSRAEALARGES